MSLRSFDVYRVSPAYILNSDLLAYSTLDRAPYGGVCTDTVALHYVGTFEAETKERALNAARAAGK